MNWHDDQAHGEKMLREWQANLTDKRQERAKIAKWLRTTARVSGMLIDISHANTIAKLADAIENGEYDK